jgi:archaellum biogenesis ATPase FlaH
MSAPSFYRVIDALDHLGALPAHIDGRQNGRLRLMARCPGHDDRSPSLSVEHKGDRTLVHCFAGCGTEHVLERLALEFADLYDERRSGRVPSASAPRGSGTVAPGTSGRRAENGRGFDSRKFKVLDVAKMVAEVPPEVPWQIDGLAVRGDVTIVTGDPGAGKSLLAPTLAGAVARGESIAGLNCERGSTVYLDAENGGREIHRRLHSLGMPDVDLAVVEADGVDLRHGDDLSGLDALVAQFGPSLLVLDSLTALWPGANERKTEDVAPTLYELKRLAERHGLAILVLHHRPKDGGEYRGTTAIAAAAQLGFTLSKAKDDPDRTRRRLHCWKCRPAPEPEDRWLHLEAERGWCSSARPSLTPARTSQRGVRRSKGNLRPVSWRPLVTTVSGWPRSRAGSA